MIEFATFPEVAVAFVATYLVHSTLLLTACWALLTVSRVQSHFLTERMWKLAAVLGIATAFVQTALGPIRPLQLLPSPGDTATVVDGAMGSAFPYPADAVDKTRPVGELAIAPQAEDITGPPAASPAGRVSPTRDVEAFYTFDDLFTTDTVESTVPGTEALEASVETPAGWPTAPARYTIVPAAVSQLEDVASPTQAEVARRTWQDLVVSTCAIVLVGSLAAGCVFLGIQTLRLSRHFQHARILKQGSARTVLDRFLKRHKIRRSVRLLSSSSHCEPFAYGLFRWTIVLPEGIVERLERRELQALLGHEVAHLVRGDVLWLWVGRVLCTCFAVQPLNYLARRNWQRAAEYLCDDWAIDRGIRSLALARCLTHVAEWRFGVMTPEVGLAAGGSKATLVQRVKRLVEDEPVRDAWQQPGRRRLLGLSAVVAIVVLVGFAPGVALPLTPSHHAAPAVSLVTNPPAMSSLSPNEWHALEEELQQLEADLQHLARFRGANQSVARHFRKVEERAASLQARRENITSLLERESQR